VGRLMYSGREAEHRLVSFKPLGMESKRKTADAFSWLQEGDMEQDSYTWNNVSGLKVGMDAKK